MFVFPIIAFVLAVFAVIFVLQNITPLTATFLLWQLHGSLALTLLATLLFGAAIAVLAFVPTFARRRSEAVAHMRREAELQGALDEHRRRLEEDRRRAEAMRQMPQSRPETEEKKEEKENQPTPSG
jgi:uncharacterized integral membrane protein